ncbi:hypothetical protein [Sinomicrobium sp. M5D2P9]
MKPIKSYKIKTSAANLGIYGGGILALISLVSFMLTAQIMFLPPLVISIGFMVIGFLNKSLESIKIYENHMQIKLAPAAPFHLIKYENIFRIEDKSKRIKKIYFNRDGKERKIVFPLNQYNKEDMDEFFEFLKDKTALN